MKFYFPKLKKINHLLSLLAFAWFLTFYLHEVYIPYRHARHCNWPKFSQNQTNIVLIADPQLIDNHTYPGRNQLLLKLSEHTVDTYIHQNYDAIMDHLKPEYLFFLGDFLDNGRSSSDEYYKKQLTRFSKIFKDHGLGNKMITNLPGNHDIGYGDTVKLHASARFSQSFGKPNSVLTINGVDIISMDTISMSNNINEEVYSESRKFMDEVDQSLKINPRILLSHVPLYRDGNIDCGPHREGKKFPVHKGYQYQTVLEYLLSFEILKKVKPDIIFSGDDHDYCDMLHVYKTQNTREITVKSISMAMGIRYPAVQLLAYEKTDNSLLYDTRICYLPVPYLNIAHYITLSVISVLVIIIWNYKQKSKFNYNILPTVSIKKGSNDLSSYLFKISEFLNNQDNNNFTNSNVPNYTSSEKENLTRKEKIKLFFKKINPTACFKQCCVLGCFVILMYCIFCSTL